MAQGSCCFPCSPTARVPPKTARSRGGYIYRGSVAGLKGRYVFGDYCSGRIWSVLLRDDRAVGLRLEPVRARNLTSFGEDGRGELYAVTLTGRVYKFVRR
jgi:hypothetical protein